MAAVHPRMAAAFALFLVGLAGLPPALLGLFGKVVVVRSAFVRDLGWLGILVAANTVIAFVYYLRVAAALFARSSELSGRDTGAYAAVRRIRSVPTATAIVVAVLALVAGFWPALIIVPHRCWGPSAVDQRCASARILVGTAGSVWPGPATLAGQWSWGTPTQPEALFWACIAGTTG